MVAAVESVSQKQMGVRSAQLRRPVSLTLKGLKLALDSDGTVNGLFSFEEGRELFGHEQVRFYKVQAGIVVHSQRPDWSLRLTPKTVQLSARIFDTVEVSQALEFYLGRSSGYLRKVRLRNVGQVPIKLRMVCLQDPTAANFGDVVGRWGSLGVNAFNRGSHVAMDEVSDPPSARVVGANPSPSKYFMTGSRSKAQELVTLGELPDGTAGMSGQVIVVSSHETELAPGESKDFTLVSIYNPVKLEDALADFGRIQQGEKQPPAAPRATVASSDRSVGEAASWAFAAVEAGKYSVDLLDRCEVLDALSYSSPDQSLAAMGTLRDQMRKDGSMPHSMAPTKSGLLETSLFLRALSRRLMISQDRKLSRSWYPIVRKLAGYLVTSSKEYLVPTDHSLPQGWRRKLGRGYPTGEIPEVTLALAAGLSTASQLSRMASKSDEGGKFRERAEMVADSLKRRLVDERGILVLCRDSSGRVRAEDTVDLGVAAYRGQVPPQVLQRGVHRLLEKDFDTPFGPRCVPTSNQVYFNPSYGSGQLGAVWPRAALAHAMVCYRAGLSGMGSLLLGKVARLVTEDTAKLGGQPGRFPYWIDVDIGEAHGDDSDPVTAARFIEAIFEGELGLSTASDGPMFAPATSSSMVWVMGADFWAGEPVSAFLGRGAGNANLFFSGQRVNSKTGMKFSKSERVETPFRGVYALSFYIPGQVICLGNSTTSAVKGAVSVNPKSPDLAKKLSTPLETYDPAKGTWSKIGTLRVAPSMSFDVALPPGEWQAFRISTG